MDNGIALIAALVAAVVTGGVVWLALRRNLPPGAAEELAAYVAAIRAQLSGVVTEDTVRTLAGAIYDTWAGGSKYITREAFIDFVLRALHGSNQAAASFPAEFAARAAFLRIVDDEAGGER